MEKDILVDVDGVSKKFARSLMTSVKLGLNDIFCAIFGISRNSHLLAGGEFWSVKNVSFKLRRGDCIGLIGHNGAGKSTLLKMLNGLIMPDTGEIIIRGRVGAMIELGAGFNPILSGRENIYLNGQILGFSKKEIDARLQAILDFAEIGEAIDSPVQNYSSGMKVRLGFAVVSQMEPDVLLIDEVLAVGDVGFQGKCMKVIHEMMTKSAVIFVSHSMPHVNRYCNRVILMDQGKIDTDSTNIQVPIDKYLNSFSRENLSNSFTSGQIKLAGITCNNIDLSATTGTIKLYSDASFVFHLKVLDEKLTSLRIRINILNKNLLIVASVVSDSVKITLPVTSIEVHTGPFNFQPDEYKLSVIVFGDNFNDALLINDSMYSLNVEGEKDYGRNIVRLKVITRLLN